MDQDERLEDQFEVDDPQYDMEKSNPPLLPHECDSCKKRFRTIDDLEEHRRVNSHQPWKRS